YIAFRQTRYIASDPARNTESLTLTLRQVLRSKHEPQRDRVEHPTDRETDRHHEPHPASLRRDGARAAEPHRPQRLPLLQRRRARAPATSVAVACARPRHPGNR